MQVAPYERVSFARSLTAEIVQRFWGTLVRGWGSSLPVRKPGALWPGRRLTREDTQLAASLAGVTAERGVLEGGHLIGTIYTAALPDEYRSRHGAYYTPPAISERLIDLASTTDLDWKSARVLDPACGGAAFLAPLAFRMLRALRRPSDVAGHRRLLKHIAEKLRGFEIDSFAAWLSEVLVEAAVLDSVIACGERLPRIVDVRDSLRAFEPQGQVDLIIGNPPYGRVRISDRQRVQFRRSLYGHANLYGLFTDMALRWARPGGVVAYVTPTSMLGGQYFKSLRSMLTKQAPPATIEFVSERTGVFDGVLQETMLAVYKKSRRWRSVQVGLIEVDEPTRAAAQHLASASLPETQGAPWILPRSVRQVPLVQQLAKMPWRLLDLGYTVSTGPLVWNRHKGQLSNGRQCGAKPVVWAESVTAAGEFRWRSEKRNHTRWFMPGEDDEWLVTRTPCVLVQRTTAKEQLRRLVAAPIRAEFIRRHGGVAVENHLNMVRPSGGILAISAEALSALLNSEAVDAAFRCINGSVAVSAFELESLPLPSPSCAAELDRLLAAGTGWAEIEAEVWRFYGGPHESAAAAKRG